MRNDPLPAKASGLERQDLALGFPGLWEAGRRTQSCAEPVGDAGARGPVGALGRRGPVEVAAPPSRRLGTDRRVSLGTGWRRVCAGDGDACVPAPVPSPVLSCLAERVNGTLC